jgi:hypothetical protein
MFLGFSKNAVAKLFGVIRAEEGRIHGNQCPVDPELRRASDSDMQI